MQYTVSVRVAYIMLLNEFDNSKKKKILTTHTCYLTH